MNSLNFLSATFGVVWKSMTNMKNKSKETEAGVIQGKARGFNSNNAENKTKETFRFCRWREQTWLMEWV